jgi:hypothetical protein
LRIALVAILLLIVCVVGWTFFIGPNRLVIREERQPGNAGYNLMMVRGTARYLVECKNSAAHRVTEQSIRDLASMVQLQGAEGAVVATTGRVDPAALQLAAARRIEVLSGVDLWRQIKHWTPHDLRAEAEARARGGAVKHAALAGAFAIVVGLVTAALADRTSPPLLVSENPTAVAPPPMPAPAPVPAPNDPVERGGPIAMPDASLTPSQLTARRSAAALEVRGNLIVKNAQWPTKSTIVVTLHQPGAAIPDGLFGEVCRVLIQYEELRYTRVQIESPALDPTAAAAVRWCQCR